MFILLSSGLRRVTPRAILLSKFVNVQRLFQFFQLIPTVFEVVKIQATEKAKSSITIIRVVCVPTRGDLKRFLYFFFIFLREPYFMCFCFAAESYLLRKTWKCRITQSQQFIQTYSVFAKHIRPTSFDPTEILRVRGAIVRRYGINHRG